MSKFFGLRVLWSPCNPGTASQLHVECLTACENNKTAQKVINNLHDVWT